MAGRGGSGHPRNRQNNDHPRRTASRPRTSTDSTPTESDVVHWILQRKNGTCEVHELLSEYLHAVSVESFLERSRDYSSLLIILHKHKPSKSLVKAFSLKARLCFAYYINGKCALPTCKNFHLCSMKIQQNKCTCTGIHNCLALEHNAMVIKARSLQEFSVDELMRICANSFLTVCLAHNTLAGCMNAKDYAFCPFIHTCEKFVRGNCPDSPCRFGHSLDIFHHNDLLIERFRFEVKSPNFKKGLLKCLLVPDVNSIFRLIISTLIENGKAGLNQQQISKATKINDGALVKAMIQLQLEIQVVANIYYIRMHEFQTCFFHNVAVGCKRENCPFFHVCRKFITGTPHPEPCISSHDLSAPRITQLFEKKMRIPLTVEQRLKVLRNSALQLCPMSERCRKKQCLELHLCKGFITKSCDSENCPRGHTFTSDHNRKVLNCHGFNVNHLPDQNNLSRLVVICSGENRTNPTHRDSRAPDKERAQSRSLSRSSTNETPRLSLPAQTKNKNKNDGDQNQAHPKAGQPKNDTSKSQKKPGDEKDPHSKAEQPKRDTVKSPKKPGHEKDVHSKAELLKKDNSKPRKKPQKTPANQNDDCANESKANVDEPMDKLVPSLMSLDVDAEEVLNQDSAPLPSKVKKKTRSAAKNKKTFKDFKPNPESGPSLPIYTFDHDDGGMDAFLKQKSQVSAMKDVPEQFVWRWLEEDDTWHLFGGEAGIQQDLLEARYQDYLDGESLGIVIFEMHQQFYEVNFSLMTQKNLTTQKLRYVERVKFNATLALNYPDLLQRVSFYKKRLPKVQPPWFPMDTKNELASDIIALKPESEEFIEVEQNFFETLSPKYYQIDRVYRVQNLNQWNVFDKKRREMKNRLADEFHEEHLFHGTPDFESVCCICNQSFDCRMSGLHGTLYGDGAYFSKSAQYSNNFTKESVANRQRYMFRGSVLAGRFTTGAKGLRRPPALGDRHKLLYDSVVDDPLCPSIFVIFQNDQAYPTHLIEYKEKMPPPSAIGARPACAPIREPVPCTQRNVHSVSPAFVEEYIPNAQAQSSRQLFSGPPVEFINHPSAQAQSTYPNAQAQSTYPSAQAQAKFPSAQAQSNYPNAQAQEKYPKYPNAQAQSNYPSAQAQENYPSAQAQSNYASAQAQSTYPGYPSAHAQEKYPNAQAQSNYPNAQAQEKYPNAQAQSNYPSAQVQENYPSAQAQSNYPSAQAQSTYPGYPSAQAQSTYSGYPGSQAPSNSQLFAGPPAEEFNKQPNVQATLSSPVPDLELSTPASGPAQINLQFFSAPTAGTTDPKPSTVPRSTTSKPHKAECSLM